jgi:peptide/nickel transport system permease protein
MTKFIIRRLIQALFVLIIVTIIVFLAVRLLPGDPILMIISQSEMNEITQEDIESLRHEYGLDRPLTVQYFDWLLNVARGDFGESIVLAEPVMKEIKRRFPITLHLSLLAFIISILVGIPAGVICAVRRGKWADTVMTILANIGVTVPIFWLGIMMIYFFSLYLHWLPVYGYTSPFVDFTKSVKQQIMPVICLSIFSIASLSRQTRSSMLEVMHHDYIRTAWSKGFTERYIIFRHALKNSLIPIVTLLGLSFSHIIGGSVLIETVFNIPGLGRMAVNAVFAQDYSVVQGFTFLIAVFILLTNLAVDISYGWLDPRIRYE